MKLNINFDDFTKNHKNKKNEPQLSVTFNGVKQKNKTNPDNTGEGDQV